MQSEVVWRDKAQPTAPGKFTSPKLAGVALDLALQELTREGQLNFVSFVIKNTILV
jgi:hypothetical protein